MNDSNESSKNFDGKEKNVMFVDDTLKSSVKSKKENVEHDKKKKPSGGRESSDGTMLK